MTFDAFREMLHASPFQPSSIHMADGKAYTVAHPDFVALSAGGRTAIVYLEGERFAVIDIDRILRFESNSAEIS